MSVKGGATTLTVDGEVWPVDPESTTWSVRKVMHEAVVAGQGMVGTSEKGKAPFIAAKIYRDESRDYSSLEGEKQTVILTTKTHEVTLRNATLVGDLEEDAGTASASIRFEGLDGKAVR